MAHKFLWKSSGGGEVFCLDNPGGRGGLVLSEIREGGGGGLKMCPSITEVWIFPRITHSAKFKIRGIQSHKTKCSKTNFHQRKKLQPKTVTKVYVNPGLISLAFEQLARAMLFNLHVIILELSF